MYNNFNNYIINIFSSIEISSKISSTKNSRLNDGPDLRKFFVNDRKSRQIKHTPDVFSTNWNSLVEVHGVSRLLSIEFSPFPLLSILAARLDYRKRERKLDNFDFLFDLKRIVFHSREISYLISY